MKFRLLALVFLASPAFGYDWPAADLQVVKSFGQRSGPAILPGVEVQTLSPLLTAPDAGDVVFVFRTEGQLVQNLPSSLGGFVALAHADNLRTVTSRLVPNASETKRSYGKGEPLGNTAVQAGTGESRHRLFVFDQQLGEIVNPLLVYPPLPDARQPVVFDVKVVPEAKGETVSLFGQSVLAVGYWDLRVTTADPMTLFPLPGREKGGESQRGAYAVEAYLNGGEVFNSPLDSFQEKSGRWQLKGLGQDVEDVLSGDQEWHLGRLFLNEGTNILEIVVRDFQGNQTGKTFRIRGSR